MRNTNFEYSVSSRRHSTTPLTAELRCTEVFRKQIRFFTDEINLLSLPERTIVTHSTSIPLNEPNSSTNTRNYVVVARSPNESTVISRPNKTTSNHSLNCARILKILGSFGVTEHGCSTILRDIDKALILSSSSSSSKGTGVIEVKIWKIRTVFYKLNKDVERLLMETCYSDISAISSLLVFGYNSNGSTNTMEEKDECVICMEDCTERSLGIKLPCKHEFHEPCIFKWLQIKNQCPLCRFRISKGVKYYVDFIHLIGLIRYP